MSACLKLRNLVYTEGTIIKANRDAEDVGHYRKDELLKIAKLQWTKEGDVSIGVFSQRKRSGFHNLDGMVPDNQGYWVSPIELITYFSIEKLKLSISKSFCFRGKDLIGKIGVLICQYDNLQSDLHNGVLQRPSHFFVEFDEDICGITCDGIGKKGHCAMVPRINIKFEKEEEAKALFL